MPVTIAKRLNCSSTSKADQRLQRPGRPAPAPTLTWPAGNRPRARALDAGVEVAVDDVVPGAARAAHDEGADEEEDDAPADCAASRGDAAASAADHQHGISSSHDPIGRSRRASRKIGPRPAAAQAYRPSCRSHRQRGRPRRSSERDHRARTLPFSVSKVLRPS